jgi:tetratricopeptide (TPR) repeat protein
MTTIKNKSTFEKLVTALSLDVNQFYKAPQLVCNNSFDYQALREQQNKSHAFKLAFEGIELLKEKESAKAMKKFASALELDPDCVEAFVGRGCLYANEKKYQLAIEDLEAALEIEPGHKNAKIYLGDIEEKQRQKKLERSKREKLIRAGEFILPYSTK